MDTAAAQAGGNKIDVDSLCVGQAGCVPCDIEGTTARNSLTLRGADIKTACCACCKDQDLAQCTFHSFVNLQERFWCVCGAPACPTRTCANPRLFMSVKYGFFLLGWLQFGYKNPSEKKSVSAVSRGLMKGMAGGTCSRLTGIGCDGGWPTSY